MEGAAVLGLSEVFFMSSQPESLVSKSCTPCRGGIPPLNKNGVKAYRRHTPEWATRDEDRRIERTFKFKDFAEALAFIKRAGDLAEAEGHHPDISFGWGYATISLQTKKIKGLHENDFIMAAKLDQLAHFRRMTRRSSNPPSLLESATDLVSSDKQLTHLID
jgi:4a-hydroxytetrahydrobiopterin dehydratase